MTQPQTHASDDRDLLIRVDTDLKHIDKSLTEVRNRQNEHDKRSGVLTDQLTQLTFNVGAIAKSLEKAEGMVGKQTEHEARIQNIEEKLDEVIDNQVKGQAQWQPMVDLFGHWKWMVAGAVAIAGVVGWPTISKVLTLIAGA